MPLAWFIFLILLESTSFAQQQSSSLSSAGEGRSFRFPEDGLQQTRETGGGGVADLVTNTFQTQAAVIGLFEDRPGTRRNDSGQLIRLRGGRDVNVGYVEIFSGNSWHLLCDPQPSSSWELQEANVACRQLGYSDGAVHTTRGNSTLGDLAFVLHDEVSLGTIAISLECHGEEGDLGECQWRRSNARCDLDRGVVGLACARPSFALCPGSSEPFGESCYEVVEDARSFLDAHNTCKSRGGHLAEVDDQIENNFLSEHLLQLGVDNVWIGGILNSVGGRSFMTWFQSKTPIEFARFKNLPEANRNQLSANGIVLKKSWGYYYWEEKNLTFEADGFICELPQIDIGCINESGSDYEGIASRGESGRTCLPWNTEGIHSIFANQNSWTHNHCRNPGGDEESPICFIDHEEYDYCTIPKCDAVRRREAVARVTSVCPPEEHRTTTHPLDFGSHGLVSADFFAFLNYPIFFSF